jgi:arginyl-tRNA---protein transferase
MVHRIDGEVAIVGVLDITADCLSSVYLYYDPKFEFLSPGTLAALREIEYVKKVLKGGQAPPTFKYYYMGLYY